MKKRYSLWVFLAIFVVLQMTFVLAADEAEIKIFVNDRQLNTEVPPVLEHNRVLVPLRAIFEALDADVKWDNNTQTVSASKNSNSIILQIDADQAYINNKAVKLEVNAKIVRDRTMVPVRFVSEALGAEVTWDQNNNTVRISNTDLALSESKSAETLGSTAICLLKDNKAAAISITMDDALLASDTFFNELFKKYNLNGTLALISDRMDNTSSWSSFRELLNDGKLDVGNHSLTHKKLTTVDEKTLESEVNGARQRFRKEFPDQDVICMIYPENASNDTVRAKVKEQHYAARGGIRGDNSLVPTDAEWFNLKTRGLKKAEPGQGTGPNGEVLVSDMNGWIDSAIANGRWVIEMLHGVKEEDPYSYDPPASADVDDHFSYLSGKLDQIWCGTFSEVTKYIRERQNASIDQLPTDGSYISIRLQDTLDDTIFDFPLTLKTQVPKAWKSVRVEQNDKKQIIIPKEDAGIKYILYDAVPDKGRINLYQNE